MATTIDRFKMMEEAVAIEFYHAILKHREDKEKSWRKFIDECYCDMPIDIKIHKDATESFNKRKREGGDKRGWITINIT